MTRTRRFLGGLGVGYASQAVLTLIGLWLTRFLLTRLGQHDYGLWLVGTQVLAYLMLMDLGVVALLPRDVAYATGRGQDSGGRASLADLVGQTTRIVLWQMPLVALVAGGFWLFLPNEWEPLRRPLGVVMAAFVLTFPLRVPQAVLRGLQDLAFLGATQTGAWLGGTGLTVALVYRGSGLEALAAGWVANQVLAGAIAWLRLRHRFPEALPPRIPPLVPGDLRQRLGRGAWISVSQIAQVLLNGTDVLIMGKLLGAAAVVPYACTGKLIGVLAHQPQMLMHAAEPGLSEMKTGESRERIRRVSDALTQGILMFSGVIICTVLVVNRGFVGLWVGEAQWGGGWLSLLILLRTLLFHWNLTASAAIFAFGYERRLAWVGLLDGVVTIAASVALVRGLGPLGAPLGSIAGVSLVSLPLNLSALARETGTSVSELIRSQWPWAWRFLLVLAGAAGAAVAWPARTIPGLVLAGSVVASGYALLMLGRVLRPPLSLYLHPRLAAWLTRLPRTLRAGAPSDFRFRRQLRHALRFLDVEPTSGKRPV